MSVVLVAGPSCGGKSTYVREHMEVGDEVVDFGDVLEELGADRYDTTPSPTLDRALAAWKARADAPMRPDRTRWVIWTAPKRAQRGQFRERNGARVLVVMASEAVCLERARDQRPAASQELIREWFRTWEPSRSGSEGIVRTD